MNSFTIFQLLASIICITLGALTLLRPKGIIYRMVSWRYREAEAPAAAPVLDRLGGILLTLAGILLLIA